MTSLTDPTPSPETALSAAIITGAFETFPELEGHELLEEAAWLELRDSGLSPDEVTDLATTWETRLEFLIGATMLGLIGGGRTAKPQQLLVADMLNAGATIDGILEPRRSTKTSSILAVMVGRCFTRPRRNSAFTLATTGLKAREKFREEVIDPIEARWPDAATRPVRIHKAGGAERLEFRNRSVFAVHPPIGSSFRGSAYDDVLVDEGGEADATMTEDLLAAIPPTFDTTGGQLIVSGTAGKRREGSLLWDVLYTKREALEAGVLIYAASDKTTEEELADWEPSEKHPNACVRDLVLAHHPGVQPGNLTPLDAVRRSFLLMPRDVFTREYLGIFDDIGGTTSLFDPIKWARTGVDGALPSPPERFSLAFAPHPDQLTVSVLAAWRDEKGRAVALQLEHLQGIDKAAPTLLRYARKYRVPIILDGGSQVAQLIVEKLNQANPRPKLQPYAYLDVKKAASLVVDEVDRENVVHYRDQLTLTEAAHKTVKRKSGDRGWLLGRDPKRPDDDITPVEAWALALLHYDTTRPKARAKGRVSS